MISASHNPFDDNGIKLFGPDGYKLSDAIEVDIEKLVDSDLTKKLAKGADLGRAKRIDGVHDRYIEFAKRTLPRSMSYNRAVRYARVVFPDPVSPTSAVVVPAGTLKETSRRVHSWSV